MAPGLIRRPVVAVITVGALFVLVGCVGGHSATVDDFRDFLRVREPSARPALVATFFEVGLGDAILLELPSGKCLLVDAGIGVYSHSILNYLEARGIERLDGMLLTHPHMDHYGGMKDVIEAIPVGRFYHNGTASSAESYSGLREGIRSRGIPETVLRRGDELPELCGAGTRIEVLYPDETALETRSDANGGSIVLRVSHAGNVVLLTGDAENEEESRLLELEGEHLRADVIKLGHHGSMFSGSREFLRAVRPEVAVVQGTRWADVHPFYPRPSYPIRCRLESMDVPLLNSKHQGTVQITCDGTGVHWQTMRDTRAARAEVRELPVSSADSRRPFGHDREWSEPAAHPAAPHQAVARRGGTAAGALLPAAASTRQVDADRLHPGEGVRGHDRRRAIRAHAPSPGASLLELGMGDRVPVRGDGGARARRAVGALRASIMPCLLYSGISWVACRR